ncbi:MAG: hypothetical protein J3Q66DRAFT_442253 [Benniella sp.]|nr:MAG: hypothetical protein J3Q66DRAFT_442253 [Benniella sp.]
MPLIHIRHAEDLKEHVQEFTDQVLDIADSPYSSRDNNIGSLTSARYHGHGLHYHYRGPYAEEPLIPALFYITVAGNIVFRFLSPAALSLGAAAFCIPKTTNNVLHGIRTYNYGSSSRVRKWGRELEDQADHTSRDWMRRAQDLRDAGEDRFKDAKREVRPRAEDMQEDGRRRFRKLERDVDGSHRGRFEERKEYAGRGSRRSVTEAAKEGRSWWPQREDRYSEPEEKAPWWKAGSTSKDQAMEQFSQAKDHATRGMGHLKDSLKENAQSGRSWVSDKTDQYEYGKHQAEREFHDKFSRDRHYRHEQGRDYGGLYPHNHGTSLDSSDNWFHLSHGEDNRASAGRGRERGM